MKLTSQRLWYFDLLCHFHLSVHPKNRVLIFVGRTVRFSVVSVQPSRQLCLHVRTMIMNRNNLKAKIYLALRNTQVLLIFLAYLPSV